MAYLSSSIFGNIDGKDIICFRIQNINGSYIEILNYGCIVHAWGSPDRDGKIEDILLGCNDIEGYKNRHPYFGCLVGRYANRINQGKYTYEGIEYQLSVNLGDHHLHGGLIGLDQYVFDYEVVHATDDVSLIFRATSPDGDQGFPGNLHVIVIYTFTSDNSLIIRYKATTDKTTPVNLTNHCYFNLSGNQVSDILDHSVSINADKILDVDDNLIPTGSFFPLINTLLDLKHSTPINQIMDVNKSEFNRQKGWDHCYVLNENRNLSDALASCFHNGSGRLLEVFSDMPYIQFYTGNWLDGTEGKIGKYKDYNGLCLETQNAPDAVNHTNLGNVFLHPDEEFYSMTMYRISVK